MPRNAAPMRTGSARANCTPFESLIAASGTGPQPRPGYPSPAWRAISRRSRGSDRARGSPRPGGSAGCEILRRRNQEVDRLLRRELDIAALVQHVHVRPQNEFRRPFDAFSGVREEVRRFVVQPPAFLSAGEEECRRLHDVVVARAEAVGERHGPDRHERRMALRRLHAVCEEMVECRRGRSRRRRRDRRGGTNSSAPMSVRRP